MKFTQRRSNTLLLIPGEDAGDDAEHQTDGTKENPSLLGLLILQSLLLGFQVSQLQSQPTTLLTPPHLFQAYLAFPCLSGKMSFISRGVPLVMDTSGQRSSLPRLAPTLPNLLQSNKVPVPQSNKVPVPLALFRLVIMWRIEEIISVMKFNAFEEWCLKDRPPDCPEVQQDIQAVFCLQSQTLPVPLLGNHAAFQAHQTKLHSKQASKHSKLNTECASPSNSFSLHTRMCFIVSEV